MKLFLSILFTLYSLTVLAQSRFSEKNTVASSKGFTLSLTTYNHASQIFLNGVTTYALTDTSIEVSQRSIFDKESKVVFFRWLHASENPCIAIKNIGLDLASDHYTNWCIMLTSGDEYSLGYNNGVLKKQIWLHHYHLKQLDNIVVIINSLIPKKYQLRYLPEDTKQDCEP